MKQGHSKKKLTAAEQKEIIETLRTRFEKNPKRHPGIQWSDVEKRLEANSSKLWSLRAMEESEGEPDVIGYDKRNDQFIFTDCSPETPKGRRSICYDHEALEARKEHKPANSAVNMAEEMGIELLDESAYRELQKLGEFDTKTSSWIKTPPAIRSLGGALFCDRRYNHIFVYHNGAESYYAVRGFRGKLVI